MNYFITKKTVQTSKEKIRDIEEQLEELGKNKLPEAAPVIEIQNIPQGQSLDLKQLANLFAAKGTVSDIEKRLSQVEKNDKSQDSQLKNHEGRIITLESQFKDLQAQLNEVDAKFADLGKNQPVARPVTRGGKTTDSDVVMSLIQQLQSQMTQKAEKSDVVEIQKQIILKAD